MAGGRRGRTAAAIGAGGAQCSCVLCACEPCLSVCARACAGIYKKKRESSARCHHFSRKRLWGCYIKLTFEGIGEAATDEEGAQVDVLGGEKLVRGVLVPIEELKVQSVKL